MSARIYLSGRELLNSNTRDIIYEETVFCWSDNFPFQRHMYKWGIRFRSAIKTFGLAEKFYWITLSNSDLQLWTAQSKSFHITEIYPNNLISSQKQRKTSIISTETILVFLQNCVPLVSKTLVCLWKEEFWTSFIEPF